MVLLRVIWRLVDLNVKQIMPWYELTEGPRSAHRTVLLDYVSPSLLPNLWKAIKLQHWAVATTIAGNLLLLLTLVFITGLFHLETTFVAEENALLKVSGFNGSTFDISKLDGSSGLLSLAILTQNLSYLMGTNLDTVVPLIDSNSEYPTNATIQAVVSGL